ncbi:hypothetical protein B0H13DRAFT_2671508 [Mycena leptocephala]|nr:hypothetical protein B0H13DRAFT_2671508 [Mycena leptocephala]
MNFFTALFAILSVALVATAAPTAVEVRCDARRDNVDHARNAVAGDSRCF